VIGVVFVDEEHGDGVATSVDCEEILNPSQTLKLTEEKINAYIL
jgi:hypothetical protein